MRKRISALIIAALTACLGGPTGPEGSCVAVVNVDCVLYSAAPDPRPEPGAVYLEITRHTGCLDQGERADPLAHGESNFLEVGTTLHPIDGFEPRQRLAYWAPVISEWLALSPLR